MAIPNIVIFGETGAGKSSLVNLIASDDIVAPISSRSVGCTFRSMCFSTVNVGGKYFNLHDTAGLDEGQGVAKHDAIMLCITPEAISRGHPSLLHARPKN